MKFSIRKILFICMFSLCAFPVLVSSASMKGNNKDMKLGIPGLSKILWQPEIIKNNLHEIKGSTKADFGSFEFSWITNPDRSAKLITMESSGGGELPAKEKKLLPLVLDSKNTLLFHEWPALLNSNKPNTIRVIANVNTKDLFSVIKNTKIPPSSIVPVELNSITWGAVSNQNDTNYIEGKTKNSAGSLNVIWKKKKNGIPELILLNSTGGGELPPIEEKLYLWINESTGFNYYLSGTASFA